MGTGGEVANALVCKTSIRRFDPDPVLHNIIQEQERLPRTSGSLSRCRGDLEGFHSCLCTLIAIACLTADGGAGMCVRLGWTFLPEKWEEGVSWAHSWTVLAEFIRINLEVFMACPRRALILALSLAGVCSALPARADILQYNISGTIAIPGLPSTLGGVSFGSRNISFSAIVDSSTVTTMPISGFFPTVGQAYTGFTQSVSLPLVTVSNADFGTATLLDPFALQVYVYRFGNGYDAYPAFELVRFTDINTNYSNGGSIYINGAVPDEYLFDLTRPSAGNDSDPTGLSATAFATDRGDLSFYRRVAEFSTTEVAATAPEPASLLLMMSGLALPLCQRAKRWRQQRDSPAHM